MVKEPGLKGNAHNLPSARRGCEASWVPGNGQDPLISFAERHLSAPARLYITHPLCLHRPSHGARGLASGETITSSHFCSLIPAVSHLSRDGEGHVQTALPSSPPTLLPPRPVSGWWVEGTVPTARGPVFPGRERRAGFCSWNAGPTPSGLPARGRKGRTLMIKAGGLLRKLLPREKSKFLFSKFPGCGEPQPPEMAGQTSRTFHPSHTKTNRLEQKPTS